MVDERSSLTQRGTRAQQLFNLIFQGFSGVPAVTGQEARVQDLLSGLALNVLTAFGRIDPEIYFRDPDSKQLKLREDLKPHDDERGALLQKAFALVQSHPGASRALALGYEKALAAWRKGGWSPTAYDVRVEALSTLETGKPFYRFRVVGKDAPDVRQWQELFLPQYVLKLRRSREGQIPALLDERSGLMFSKVAILCHPFAAATLPIIQSWIGDCCKFNGKHGQVQTTSDPTKMKCKT
jgi:hypothetical protein